MVYFERLFLYIILHYLLIFTNLPRQFIFLNVNPVLDCLLPKKTPKYFA